MEVHKPLHMYFLTRKNPLTNNQEEAKHPVTNLDCQLTKPPHSSVEKRAARVFSKKISKRLAGEKNNKRET